jgi:hypothetical protein
MSSDRRQVLRWLGGALAAWPLRLLGCQRRPPNFIVMMTDDQRADALGVAPSGAEDARGGALPMSAVPPAHWPREGCPGRLAPTAAVTASA